ncbi:MAG: translation initiation factor IF-3, partial [Armatimonadetes bacterium CG07_land_8_20_14_0_80_40_9]
MRINEKIQAREVRVISAEGKPLGVLPLREAQERARENDLDLVEIASQATPPVCRIMDYDKYRYEQSKKEKEAQKKQKGSILKEVWMRTRIGEHDYQVKAK